MNSYNLNVPPLHHGNLVVFFGIQGMIVPTQLYPENYFINFLNFQDPIIKQTGFQGKKG